MISNTLPPSLLMTLLPKKVMKKLVLDYTDVSTVVIQPDDDEDTNELACALGNTVAGYVTMNNEDTQDQEPLMLLVKRIEQDTDIFIGFIPCNREKVKQQMESQGLKGQRKRGGDSSDEEFNEFESLKNKKRAYPEPNKIKNKRPAPDTHQEQETIEGDGEDFKVGDFLMLKGEVDDPHSALWQVDGKTIIQKYECFEKANNKYKNVSTYKGWTSSTRHKYASVAVKVVKQSAKETVVIRLGPDAVVEQDSKPPDSPKSPTKPVNNEEIRQKSISETSQFQENFEVYMQTLISQCLDADFINEIFSKQDDYFMTNIEKVDSVTLLRTDKLMTGVSWTLRFQHALSVWPFLNDLGSVVYTSNVCEACEKNKADTMLQMFGQPYNSNTLSTIPPDPEAMMNKNFSVCVDCSRLCSLFHKLHHQKQKLYIMCSEIVEKRKTENPGIDTTQILNQLLADDTLLETHFKKMQALWGDADCYIHPKP